MIRKGWRAILKLLGSPALAFGLLVFMGVWSMVATAIPQESASTRVVADWSAKYAALEAVVRPLGLHNAFTAPAFIACVALLGLSTAVCSWNQTKVALHRARALHEAAAADAGAIAAKHDLEIACDPAVDGESLLADAAERLAELGIKTASRDGVLVAVSPAWSVWGSSVFHWALLVLMASAFVGYMLRAEGLMTLVVGQAKADAAGSYSKLTTGPWHDWARIRRSIRLDDFEPSFASDGIDRGAVPTVSVLDKDGKVLVTQRVYPNMKLHSGSLSINAPSLGLAPTLEFLSAAGALSGRNTHLVAFSQTTTGGTVPLGAFSRVDPATGKKLTMVVTVPLDSVDGMYGEWVPKQPAVRMRIVSSDGRVVYDETVLQGEIAELPGGSRARLAGIGWYSHLSLVDDPSIPFIYGSMIIGMLGLTLSLATRQQLLVATVIEGPERVALALRLRLWRNAPITRDEIEDELAAALGAQNKKETGL